MRFLGVDSAPLSKEARALLCISLLVLLIKAGLFVLDPYPGFHFGDSGAYLATALVKWIPPDRSFTYGFLLRPLILPTHSLLPVLLLQIGMSAFASILLGFLLKRYFKASDGVALCCSVLCALEPLQVMSERFVMTEAAATFGLALLVWAWLAFLASGKIWLLVTAQVVGVGIVSLRYSFIPLMLVLSGILPVLSGRGNGGKEPFRPVLVRLFVAILVSQALLAGYRHLYGYLAQSEPAYLSRDGYFLVSDFVPLLEPEDFPIAGERARLFQSITIPRSGIDTRRLHRWLPGGICDALQQIAGGNEDLANRWAKAMALHAMWRSPMGVLEVATHTFFEFFNPRKIEWALRLDHGDFVAPTQDDVQMIQRWFGIDATNRHFDSLTKRWERLAVPWCWVMVTLPMFYAVEIALHWGRAGRFDVFLLLTQWLLFLAAVIPVEIANPRYLTPLPWLSILIVGVMVSRFRVSTAALPGERP